MVFAHPTRRSDDDRLVDRFTHRVPKEVIAEFNHQLDKDTVREVRAIAQALTTTNPTGERTMTTTKRTPTTKRAEPVTPTTKPTAKSAVKAKPKKAAKKAKPTDRASVLAAYMQDKLKIQKGVKIGAVIVYHGRNETIDGKSVKVVEYESRGGIWVEFRGERYVVSPHALLEKKS